MVRIIFGIPCLVLSGWLLFGSVFGMALPTSCNPGQYLEGSLCLVCSPGTYSEGGTATSCTPCGEGTFAPNFESASCTACPSGSFQDQEGQITCIDCEAGSFASGTGSIGCTLASPGTYVSTAAATSPIECSPGTYQDTAGQTQCILCEAGSYNAITGQTFCSECPIGTVNNSEGNTECERCDGNTYSDTSGGNVCKTCESGFSARQENYTGDFLECEDQNNCSLGIFGNNICEPLQFLGSNGKGSSIPKSLFLDKETQQEEQTIDSGTQDIESKDTSLYIPTLQEKNILDTAVSTLLEYSRKNEISHEQLIDAIQLFAQKYDYSSRKYQLLMRLISMLQETI